MNISFVGHSSFEEDTLLDIFQKYMPSQFAKCVGTFTKFLLAKKCYVLLLFLGLSTNIIGYCHFFTRLIKLGYCLLNIHLWVENSCFAVFFVSENIR